MQTTATNNFFVSVVQTSGNGMQAKVSLFESWQHCTRLLTVVLQNTTTPFTLASCRRESGRAVAEWGSCICYAVHLLTSSLDQLLPQERFLHNLLPLPYAYAKLSISGVFVCHCHSHRVLK